jgi:hypothetical protein
VMYGAGSYSAALQMVQDFIHKDGAAAIDATTVDFSIKPKEG